MILRSSFDQSKESDTARMPLICPTQDVEETDVVSAQRRPKTENWMSLMKQEPICTELLSGFSSHSNSHVLCSQLISLEPDLQAQPSKETKSAETALVGGEPDKPFQSCTQFNIDV
eukprot:TRINITY_DN34288_c1_g1_i3.p1 TRINITY_DN34288_c1_g1~~TRINITY_DN34288_c1_g1_i3.p1  ORF type:complete len:116 (-),score=24.73 TRINITY_DN34288_c1_g1_i3:40-387(-)